MLEKITAWMFRHRTPLVCGFGVLTAVMAWFGADEALLEGAHDALAHGGSVGFRLEL